MTLQWREAGVAHRLIAVMAAVNIGGVRGGNEAEMAAPGESTLSPEA